MRWTNWKDSLITRRRTSVGAKFNHEGDVFWKQQPMWSKYTSGTYKELSPTVAGGGQMMRKYPHMVIQAVFWCPKL